MPEIARAAAQGQDEIIVREDAAFEKHLPFAQIKTSNLLEQNCNLRAP